MKGTEFKELREKMRLTQDQMADYLEISKRTVINYEKDVNPIPPRIIRVIRELYESEKVQQNVVNDPKAKYAMPKFNQPIVVTVDTSGEEVIPTVPITAKAGYIRKHTDPEFIEDLPISILPEKKFRGMTTRCFQVEGPSMEGTIRNGSYVYGTLVDPSYWESDIKNHMVYVVVTEDDLIIKRVHNKIKEAGIIICYSDNSEFEPQVLDVSEIKEIWKARRKYDGDFSKKAITSGNHLDGYLDDED